MLSEGSRAKGRTGIEESKQSHVLNNDLIFAVKENERRECGVKRELFLMFNGRYLGVIYGISKK